jgi:hypothetical protein
MKNFTWVITLAIFIIGGSFGLVANAEGNEVDARLGKVVAVKVGNKFETRCFLKNKKGEVKLQECQGYEVALEEQIRGKDIVNCTFYHLEVYDKNTGNRVGKGKEKFANKTYGPCPDGASFLASYIKILYQYGASIVGIIAVVILVSGGLMIMLGGLEQNLVETAKKMIFISISSLILLFMTGALLKFVNYEFYGKTGISLQDKVKIGANSDSS